VLLRQVPAGLRRIEVRKEGYEPWSTQAAVEGGKVLELMAALQPLPGRVGDPGVDGGVRGSGRGWTVAFWTGAAVTVGLAVGMTLTGLSVLGLEDDKDEEIRRLLSDPSGLSTQAENELRNPDGDACSVADQAPGSLADICDKGTTRATVFNVLLAGALVSAAATGFFFYKAYLAPSTSVEATEDPLASVPRWRLLAGMGSRSARLGLAVDF
jgi:hypothetical protein